MLGFFSLSSRTKSGATENFVCNISWWANPGICVAFLGFRKGPHVQVNLFLFSVEKFGCTKFQLTMVYFQWSAASQRFLSGFGTFDRYFWVSYYVHLFSTTDNFSQSRFGRFRAIILFKKFCSVRMLDTVPMLDWFPNSKWQKNLSQNVFCVGLEKAWPETFYASSISWTLITVFKDEFRENGIEESWWRGLWFVDTLAIGLSDITMSENGDRKMVVDGWSCLLSWLCFFIALSSMDFLPDTAEL